MEISQYEEMVGERIQEWIDYSLTFENGCKRAFNSEIDNFEGVDVAWMFTQKGQRLYDSYVRRAGNLIRKKYPNEAYYEDLERYTGVIYD